MPTPKQIEKLVGSFQIFPDTHILLRPTASRDEIAIGVELARELGRPFGTHLRRVTGTAHLRHDIRLTLVEAIASEKLRNGGYTLKLCEDGATIVAAEPRGLFWGAQTLQQLAPFGKMPAMLITDWPDIPDRTALFDVRDTSVQVPYVKRWLDILSYFKVGGYMPFMEDDFHFSSRPYLGRLHTYTHKNARELVAHAKKRHIEIVPQIESFGHAWGLLKHDELKETRHRGEPWQFSACSEKTYEVFRDLYRELVKAFPQSQYFHIGADEVGGWDLGHTWTFENDPRCAELLREIGKEGIWARHVNRLAQIVRDLGRKPMIWHDEITYNPQLAEKLDKDIVIVIWLYERTDDFHEIQIFKDFGFKSVWAAPAVHGFKDVYQWIPISFGNLAGFSDAAVREKLPGMIVTSWGATRGGNAENYLYGLSYASQVMWNRGASDIADFNRRFAYIWFGITAEAAADHVDRLFWFPWRISGSAAWDKKDIEGRWQKIGETHRVFFHPFDEMLKGLADEVKEEPAGHGSTEIEKRIDEEILKDVADAYRLLEHVKVARRSHEWLKRESTKNKMTLELMDLVLRDYEHYARKTIAVYETALAYRKTYRETPFSTKAHRTVLLEGTKQLKSLRSDFPAIEKGYRRAIRTRGGDPTDLARVKVARTSLEKLIAIWELHTVELKYGSSPSPPKEVGLRSQ